MSELQNQIVVYQPDDVMRLEVRLENDTVWLTQSKLAELFAVDRTVVNRHIRNIYSSQELDETSTCAKIAQVQNEGGRQISKLDYFPVDYSARICYNFFVFVCAWTPAVYSSAERCRYKKRKNINEVRCA